MEELTEGQELQLDGVVTDLHVRYGGAFSHEMIEALVHEIYAIKVAAATVATWLVLGTECDCIDRLEQLTRDARVRPQSAPAGQPALVSVQG